MTFIDFIVYPLWETWAELVYPDAQDILENINKTREFWNSQLPNSPPPSSSSEDSEDTPTESFNPHNTRSHSAPRAEGPRTDSLTVVSSPTSSLTSVDSERSSFSNSPASERRYVRVMNWILAQVCVGFELAIIACVLACIRIVDYWCYL